MDKGDDCKLDADDVLLGGASGDWTSSVAFTFAKGSASLEVICDLKRVSVESTGGCDAMRAVTDWSSPEACTIPVSEDVMSGGSESSGAWGRGLPMSVDDDRLRLP